MTQQEASGFCRHCHRQVLVRRRATNHILHLLLTVFTVGLWLGVWMLVSIKIGGWRCTLCGMKVSRNLSILEAVAAAIVALLSIGFFSSFLRWSTDTSTPPARVNSTPAIGVRNLEPAPAPTPPPVQPSETSDDPAVARILAQRIAAYNQRLAAWSAANANRSGAEIEKTQIESELAAVDSVTPKPPHFEERKWTTRDEKHTTIAVLVETGNSTVTLRKSDNKNVTIQKSGLKMEDRLYVEKAYVDLNIFRDRVKDQESKRQELLKKLSFAADQIAAADKPKPQEPTRQQVVDELAAQQAAQQKRAGERALPFSILREWKPNKERNGVGMEILVDKTKISESALIELIQSLASGHDPVVIDVFTSQAGYDQLKTELGPEGRLGSKARSDFILAYVKNGTGKGAFRGFNEIRWMQEVGPFASKFGTVTKLETP